MSVRVLVVGLVCLCVLASLSSGLLVGCQGSGPTRNDIAAAQLETMLSDGQPLLLIDVRTSDEFSPGHIPGAVNQPVETIVQWYGALDPSQRTVCYCKAGSRSRRAADYLVSKGFSNVSNLLGGFDGWPGAVETD
jgi:rhodanese-related sulfurtransferase